MLVFGIDIKDLSWFLFQRFQASAECTIRHTILRFNQILIITVLLWFILISITDELCQPSQKCQKSSLCCHAYLDSKGILTFSPFPSLLLGDRLGLTYPWLIFIVKEPLPFRWQRFSLCFILTTTRILIPDRSTLICINASALPERLPTIHLRWSSVSVIGLALSVLEAYNLDK